jgi:hypothetical protein
VSAAPSPSSTRAEALLAEADALVEAGRALDAIDLLHGALREERDSAVECRLAEVRHAAFACVTPASRFAEWPVPVDDVDRSGPAHIPAIRPADLSADAVRRAVATWGSAYVPGLISPAWVQRFVDGIEHVLEVRAANQDAPFKTHSSWFRGLPLPREQAISLARPWVAGDGGMLACDSPRLLDMVFTAYEEVGLKQVITDYLGERPILSGNKATLRRARLDGKTDWHQDGAFLGSKAGIRALNVWVALTDCGVDAPGMDIVPKRFESVQETGTGGAIFDWAVGPDTVASLSVDAPVVRPQYQAGDVMLFDDMLLHRTALDPSMTHTRHAIESWFFAATDYPEGQVPLVW